eukprot:s3206_g3.t2
MRRFLCSGETQQPRGKRIPRWALLSDSCFGRRQSSSRAFLGLKRYQTRSSCGHWDLWSFLVPGVAVAYRMFVAPVLFTF